MAPPSPPVTPPSAAPVATGRGELAQAALVAVVSLAAAYLCGPRELGHGDTQAYLRMADGAGAVPAPFAYRVLVPALVGALPLSSAHGFLAVTLMATFAGLLIVPALLRALGVSATAALATVPLLALSYPVAYYVGTAGLVDPVGNLVVVAAVLAIVRERWLAASLLITVGCVAKETSLLLLPWLGLAMFAPRAGRPRPAPWRIVLALAAPVLAFLALHAAVTPLAPAGGGQGLAALGRGIFRFKTRHVGLLARVSREVLRPYGFLWVAAGLGLRTMKRGRAPWLYLVAAGAALCVVAADWSRMLGWGFLGIFVPVAAFVDRVVQRDARWPRHLGAIGLLALVQGWLALIPYYEVDEARRLPLIAGIVSVFVAGSAAVALAHRASAAEA